MHTHDRHTELEQMDADAFDKAFQGMLASTDEPALVHPSDDVLRQVALAYLARGSIKTAFWVEDLPGLPDDQVVQIVVSRIPRQDLPVMP